MHQNTPKQYQPHGIPRYSPGTPQQPSPHSLLTSLNSEDEQNQMKPDALTKFFAKLPSYILNYPVQTILLMAVLFIIPSLGLLTIHIQTDPQELWVSKSSEGWRQQKGFEQAFGKFFRTQQLVMVSKDTSSHSNLFQKQYLTSLYLLLQLVNIKPVSPTRDNPVTVTSFCYRPVTGKGCYRPSPLDLWKMDLGSLQKDNDVQYTAMCFNPVSNMSKIPCSDENEIPIIIESIVGGKSCNDTKDQTDPRIIPSKHCWLMSEALMSTYLLNNNEYTDATAAIWERDVLIDSIHKYNAADGSFELELIKYLGALSDGTLAVPGAQPINVYDYTSAKLGVKVEILSERSIPDQIGNQTSENAWIVVVSYLTMFLYVGVAIGNFPSRVSSGFTLALAGILVVIASFVASLGVMSLFGVGVTMISGEVIPFLILAIGVDNMFIIKNSFDRQSKLLTIEKRFSEALQQVGPSITTAAICESLLFFIGSLTKIPALQAFCLQAAFAIIFNYIFQLTIFVLALARDEQRRDHHKMDVFCCIQLTERDVRQSSNFWMQVFRGTYFRLLKNRICQVLTLFTICALMMAAVFGLTHIPVGLNEQVSMRVDSDLFNYFTVEKRDIEIGPPAYIVLNGFDFRNKTQLAAITTLSNEVSKLKYVTPPLFSWFGSFSNFQNENAIWSQLCQTRGINSLPYNEQLQRFLAITIESDCCQQYGICGQQYSTDFLFDQDNNLKSTRLRVMHRPLRNSEDYIHAARQTRQCVSYALGPLLESDPSLQAYPYSLFYVYYDQYSYIRSVAIENFLLAVALVFLVVSVIQGLGAALVISVMVILITLNLMGLVYFTNWLAPDHGFIVEINAISVVNIITCIGLSVQFTAHVAISLLKGWKRYDNSKVKTLLGDSLRPSNYVSPSYLTQNPEVFGCKPHEKLKQSNNSSQQEQNEHLINMAPHDLHLKYTLTTSGSTVFIGIGLTKLIGVMVLSRAKSTLFRLYYFRMYMGMVVLGLFNGLVVLPMAMNWLEGWDWRKGTHQKVSTQTDQIL